MKKTVTLIVLIVVLAGLIVGYFVYADYKKKQEESDVEVEEDTSVNVLAVKSDDINSIRYDYLDETVSLKKDGEVWKWTEDGEFPVDQSFPEYMVNDLSYIVGQRLIADSLEKEADFGMDDPYLEITFGTADGKSYVYTIGDYNSTAKCYYFKVNTQNKIYSADESALENFLFYMLDMIEADTLPKAEAENITTVEYTVDGKTHKVTTDKSGADFYTDPYSYFYVGEDGVKVAADGEAVGNLMNAVESAGLGNVIGYKEDAELLEKYGFGESKTVVKVTFNETVETDSESDAVASVKKENSYFYYIGRYTDEEGKTEYYAMVDGSNILYKLASGANLFDALDSDFESKLVCPASADDAVSFKVDMGDKVYFYNLYDVRENSRIIGVFNSLTALVKTGKAEGEKGDHIMKVTYDMGDKELVLDVYKYDDKNCLVVFDKADDILVSAEKIDKIITDLKG